MPPEKPLPRFRLLSVRLPIRLRSASLRAKPGLTGNVTGITPYVKGLPAKQLELAREVVPGATRIGLIDDPIDPKAHPQRQEIEATGRSLEIEIVPAEVRSAADIDAAYQALASAGVQAVVVASMSTRVALSATASIWIGAIIVRRTMWTRY